MNENYYYMQLHQRKMFISISLEMNDTSPKGLNSAFFLNSRFRMKMVLNFIVVPNSFWNNLQNLDVNCAPLSDMMDSIIPWRHTISSMKILA